MRSLLPSIAAFIALAAAPALAADLPARAPLRPVAVQTAYDWSGFYIGAVAGGGVFGNEFSDLNENFIYGHWTNGGFGATVGGTIGFNVQYGSAVFGIEGDGSWVSFKRSNSSVSWETQFDAQWNWLATIRGRAGLAVDRTLVYVTAGAAFVGFKNKVYYPANGCGPGDCAQLNKNQVGFVGGGGVEYAFTNNWSFKAEYLFVGVPEKQVSDSFNPDPDYQYHFSSTAHIARIGLNYKFGGGTPVVARY